jgi:hypothetical protein
MSNTNEGLNLAYTNPADNFGSNNLRDLILVLHESGKNQETIYNVLNMIGVDKQKAYEAIECYIPKQTQNTVIKMELKEELEASKEVLNKLDALSSEDESLKKTVKELSENIDMLIGKQKAKSMKENSKNTEMKLDLKGKLKDLKTITEGMSSSFHTSSLKSIIEKYMTIANSSNYSHPVIAKGLINETKDYMWMEPISKVINEVTAFLNENVITIQLDEAYTKLKTSNRNAYFSQAYPVMEELMGLSESEIREAVKYKLASHTWIPEIKAIVEHVNSLTITGNSTTEHSVVKKFSPVIENEGGHVFHVSGSTFKLHDGQISKIDARQIGAAYLTMIAVEENAKFSENKMTFYKGKHTYEIQLNENGRNFLVDGRELAFSEKSQLKNLLVSTCHFDLNEMHKTDLLVAAYEHADKFVELDFVNSIEHRHKKGLSANIMRIGESIYINKINKAMALNEFFKVENATKAVEIVKEFINYDITPLVEDLLSEEIKTQRVVESKKNDLLDRINFLKEERNNLGKLDNKNEYITEAHNLLTEEIEKFQKEFNTLL